MASRNVKKATATGVVAGMGAAPAILWGSAVVEAKYGVPAAVTVSVLGGFFGFLARWAAKLNPHE